MDPNAWERLFGFRQALDEPAVALIVGLLILLLAVSPPIILVLDRLVGLKPAVRDDLWRRYVSWLVTAPMIVVPVLLGAAWTILAVAALSLLCFREFAAATGLLRDKLMCLLVVAGILTFAPSPSMRVAFLGAGAAISYVNYRAGKRLVEQGNR